MNHRVLWRLLAGSIPAALATIAYMHHSGLSKKMMGTLTFSLGIALLLTAVVVAFRPVWHRAGLKLEQWIPESRKAPLTVLCGLVLGVLVSLSSVGAGAIGATLILLLYPRLEARQLVGTDIAHAVPLTLVAGIGHATLGHVEWRLLLELLIGSMPGIWLGAHLTRKLPDGVIRTLLCASLLTAGWKVIQ